MILILVRSMIIFITLLIIIRLMGKRQIGEMQPFELVITIIIADLACFPMADTSIPLIYGIVAILTLFILHQIVTIIEKQGVFFKKVIDGGPSVIITPKGVNFKELMKNNLAVDDLFELMRGKGIFGLNEIEYGIIETSGRFSAITKPESGKKQYLSYLIVENGKVNKENLKLVNLDEKVISGVCPDIKKIMVLTCNLNDEIYYQLKDENYKFINLKNTGESK